MPELELLSAGLIACNHAGNSCHGTETPSERAARRKGTLMSAQRPLGVSNHVRDSSTGDELTGQFR